MTNIQYIEKEQISGLNFPKAEVLVDKDRIKERQEALLMGMKLGNNYKGKVKIVFEDDQAIKGVETTIWVVGEKHISLKGGASIPINRIHEIRIY